MLTRRGYKVEKSALSPSVIADIRKDLTVRPASASHHQPPPAFSVLKESSSSLYLPRLYAYNKLGKPEAGLKFVPHVATPHLEFAGKMRPTQQEAVDAYLREALEGSGSGTICASCGFGKTACSTYIIAKMKVKTLVICGQMFLMDQWRERIRQFIPNAKIGIMKGNKFEHEGCDIVVASLQTMISRKYPLDGFGLQIFDEVHHLSARVFVTSLMQETTRYTLGLTATPVRKDGLGRVFMWFIGEVVFRQASGDQKRTDVIVKTPRMPQRDEPRYDFAGRPDTVAMVNDLCANIERTKDLAKIVRKIMKDPNRCVLVLSERRKHLEDFHDLLSPYHAHEMGYYVGGMKQEEREKVEQSSRLILATFHIAAEAFDVKRLNTLLLASPKSDVEQSVGRVMRTLPGEGPAAPLIIDPYDPLFAGPARKRRALYKKRAYTMADPKEESDEEDCAVPVTIAFRNVKVM
jgi:superfamily II DNA or RNA helicase